MTWTDSFHNILTKFQIVSLFPTFQKENLLVLKPQDVPSSHLYDGLGIGEFSSILITSLLPYSLI